VSSRRATASRRQSGYDYTRREEALNDLSLIAAALEELVERVARRVVALQIEEQRRQMESDGLSPWMSLNTAAAYLDWPKQRLYRLTASGAIPHYKQEGRLLFNRAELERWLAGFAEGERRLDRLGETELSSRPDEKGAASK